jgi:hypothetical protein
MPVINHPDRITDYEIEKSMTDNGKMEKLLDKIFKIFTKKPNSSLKRLQKRMEPFLDADNDPAQRRKALREIKDFLDEE